MNIMAEENDPVMAEVMNILGEPASLPAATPGPNIPALSEQLAILVSTGKCKEAIGSQLTHDQVKRFSDKDVMKYYKRYETYVGAKTTGGACADMWADSRCSQRISDHSETC